MTRSRIELSELMLCIMHRLLAEGPETILFDPCTGTGKTFVAALLVSHDLIRDYDQIIMVTVQNKPNVEFMESLRKQIASDGFEITEDQVLFAKNNIDTLRDAYENRSLYDLYNQVVAWIENIPDEEYVKKKSFLEIKNRLTQAKNMIEKHIGDKEVYNDYDEDERPSELAKGDQLFRNTIRSFFYKYKASEELSKEKEKAKSAFLTTFPMVEKVYPQTTFSEKKVVVCTIHKLLKGIDLIIDHRIKWVDFKDPSFKRCFIFDESARCFLALHKQLIVCAVEQFFSESKNNRNYNNFLEVFTIFPLHNEITNKGFGPLAKELIDYLEPIANDIWKNIFPDVRRYRNMYIDIKENKNNLFRRGTFLIGTRSTVKLSYTNKELNSFVAHNEGDTFLTLDNGINMVILSSATANNRSIIANGDMEYYRSQRPGTFRSLRNKNHLQLTACLKATYPIGHQIHVGRIKGVDETNLMENWNRSGIELPDEYKQLFHPRAVKDDLVDRWFRITMRMLRRSVAKEKNANKRINKVRYQLTG